MKHIINGCPVNLRTLSEEELNNLVRMTQERLDRVQEELDSVRGERVRRDRGLDIHPTLQFDLPQPHSWEQSPA